MVDWAQQLSELHKAVWILPTAALLGAAVGVIRPIRRTLVPRSSHVIQTQVLGAIVGAMVMLVVAESLAKAFAIVGAAGLVRYRARIRDPKEAGVLLVSLALGLMTGVGMFLLAGLSCLLVILVLWLLESLEPADRTQFDLTIESKDPARVRPTLEHALRQRGVTYDLLGSSATQLRYEVTVPFGNKKLRKLNKLVRDLDNRHQGVAVDWRIRKPKTLQT